jgi:hypothetical protein
MLTGCSAATRTADVARAQASAPAPADPDLGTVMERFYGDVEGGHWAIAYAMLSPRYRRALGRDEFVAQYARFADIDASLRQSGARSLVATLTTHDRADPNRVRRFVESWTLAWDGEGWVLDALRRREI